MKPTHAYIVKLTTSIESSRLAPYAILVLFILISHVIILWTPGFFNDEEWWAFDYIRENGLSSYIQRYALTIPDFRHGFSDSLRPVLYLHLGLAAVWMRSAPLVSHMMSVLVHALACILLVRVLVMLGAAPALAYLSGAFFSLSPLTTTSVGWIGGNMDLWYIVFALLFCILLLNVAKRGLTLRSACGIVVCSGLAILSKENALLLPGAMLLLVLVTRRASPRNHIHLRDSLIGVSLSMVPMCVFLIIRMSALVVSLSGHDHPAYTPDVANVARNAVYYFAYPFLYNLHELINVVFVGPGGLVLALVAHVALVVGIDRCFGRLFAVLYLCGYFLFLLPIIALPNIQDHYLYASGIFMSIALAALIVRGWTKWKAFLACWITMILVLFVHSILNQIALYRNGSCEVAFLDSLDAIISASTNGKTKKFAIVSEPGALEHVGRRAIWGRRGYDGSRGVLVDWRRGNQPIDSTVGRVLTMTRTCAVRFAGLSDSNAGTRPVPMKDATLGRAGVTEAACINTPSIRQVDPPATVIRQGFNVQPDGQSAISVTGANFRQGATIVANDAPLPTVFGSDHWLTAFFDEALYSRRGTVEIRVRNPDRCTSPAAVFTVK